MERHTATSPVEGLSLPFFVSLGASSWSHSTGHSPSFIRQASPQNVLVVRYSMFIIYSELTRIPCSNIMIDVAPNGRGTV